MSNSDNKVALITGGTGGIGTAICIKLANMGIKIATNFRNKERAEKWQQDIKDKGYDAKIYHTDVTDYDACENLFKEIENDMGAVNILVNNAGITRDSTLRKMTKEQWDTIINTNLNSLFNTSKHVINKMIANGWGRVINISSINGQKGQLGQTNYAASKAGMHGFTKSLAQEVAHKGITVNTVSPGYIATDMVMAVKEEIRQSIIDQIPVGRLGKPEEIAALVAFLASDDAGFITGTNFSINGGHHMM